MLMILFGLKNALIDELEEEFAGEKGVSIYAHSIFLEEGDTAVRDDDAFYDALDELSERLRVFNKNRRASDNVVPDNPDSITVEEDIDEEDKAQEGFYDKVRHLKRYYCMVDNPSSGPVILPDGKCCVCEHISDTPILGDIFEEKMVDKENHIEKNRLKDEDCRECPFLPTCTDFSGCPTITRNRKREMCISELRRIEHLAEEQKLPPILLSVGGERILVKEPTREFAERYMEVTLPSYYKADQTCSMDEFEELLKA